MQRYALTVDKFLEHAAKWHTTSGVVSATASEETAAITYAALRERSLLLSGALLARGLAQGDRVGTLAWNTRDHLAVYYAAMGVGLVCHTLNPRLTAAQLSEMVNEAADRWIAVGAGLQPLLAEVLARCPGVEGVILMDGEIPPGSWRGERELWPLEELIKRHGSAVRWGDFDEESPAGLCYTSGTVGRPRGILYTHRSNYLHTLRALQADAIALTAADTVLAAVPMFHASGWGLPFAAPAVGARLVLPGRLATPAHLCSLITAHQVTVAVGVQTVWLGLADFLEREGGELPSLERVVIGGSHCPDGLVRRIEERLGVTVQTSWGMTELSPLGTIVPPRAAAPGGPRTAGRPVIGLDLKLVDDDGVTLSPQRGVVGHLRVRGASVAERYFNEEKSALDADGYLDTGDLALVDDEGNLTLAGRAKDLIKSGGEWINPVEIEGIVGSLPNIALAAVIARPDPKWGERPVLVVEPASGRTVEQGALLGALRGRIPDWWLPDQIVVLARMPLAATGKIDKRKLRQDLGAPGA
jgi:fatty-acyl-CoA synthase